MTLWSIARSPLIMGGDLRYLDEATLKLLTNRAVLAVNQASTDNRPHFVEDGTRIWSARPEGAPRERYVALFNTSNAAKEVGIALKALDLEGAVEATDLWSGARLPRTENRLARTLPPHGSGLYHLKA
jgi:hypothetical protein